MSEPCVKRRKEEEGAYLDRLEFRHDNDNNQHTPVSDPIRPTPPFGQNRTPNQIMTIYLRSTRNERSGDEPKHSHFGSFIDHHTPLDDFIPQYIQQQRLRYLRLVSDFTTRTCT